MYHVAHPHKRSTTIGRDQQGAIQILLVTLMMVLLGLTALVIDIGRARNATLSLQRSADAAAHAATGELVYSIQDSQERWKRAKRVALAMLQTNPVLGGINFPDVSNASHQVTSIDDACEDTTSDYRFQIYDNAETRIEIERGFYDFESSTPGFTPREGGSSCDPSSPARVFPPPNAVRITMTVNGIGTFFARMFGTAEFNALTVIGFSARE